MIYAVKFSKNGKVYYYDGQNKKYHNNVNVIVESDKGLMYGKVVKALNDVKDIDLNNLKKIVRATTRSDYDNYLKNLKDAELALNKAKELAKKLNLPMKFLSSLYTFDRKQLLFNFTADDRIDFRTLTKQLAAIYKTRIELRQIGVRDKASLVGGIGACGRELCCAGFLKNINSVSMNMAKNQNLALNPNKINGACGRLFCCLEYEDENYCHLRSKLPKPGDIVSDGKVIEVNLLKAKIKVESKDGEVKEVDYSDSIK